MIYRVTVPPLRLGLSDLRKEPSQTRLKLLRHLASLLRPSSTSDSESFCALGGRLLKEKESLEKTRTKEINERPLDSALIRIQDTGAIAESRILLKDTGAPSPKACPPTPHRASPALATPRHAWPRQ